jgi:ribonuclease-3
MDAEDVLAVQEIVGHEFADQDLLRQAFTHASRVDARLQSNERLEFLGDSILGAVVCECLYSRYEDLLEGELTKIKSTVVSRRACAEIAEELGLDDLLRLGKGMSNRGSLPSSVVAAVLEALIGALYIDGGFEVARRFILKCLIPHIASAADSGHQHNFKSVLQQAVQQSIDQTPQYVLMDEKGPDHAKCFEVCVEIGARRFDSCWGSSKKQAEQHAALEALIALRIAEQTDDNEVRILRARIEPSDLPDGVAN